MNQHTTQSIDRKPAAGGMPCAQCAGCGAAPTGAGPEPAPLSGVRFMAASALFFLMPLALALIAVALWRGPDITRQALVGLAGLGLGVVSAIIAAHLLQKRMPARP